MELGFVALGVPKPALAFRSSAAAFFASRSVGMLELVEAPALLPPLGLQA